jgi:hypothetical protein
MISRKVAEINTKEEFVILTYNILPQGDSVLQDGSGAAYG